MRRAKPTAAFVVPVAFLLSGRSPMKLSWLSSRPHLTSLNGAPYVTSWQPPLRVNDF
jgi:hypothetical protein